ncbi:class I SAM-dependent methyltransferase [Nocardia sp. NBC_00511]|uniref:class I SAM-dependent methyltransferase n=1 Tax=Nocardia sp. NBC_00511 TaxID=2903591 RepID=UPI0030E242AB
MQSTIEQRGGLATRARERFLAGFARQLGHPRASVMAFLLNKYNNTAITAAVTELGVTEGDRAADIGFGGGVGLGLLLEQVGTGQVYGVDISEPMLRRAARRYRGRVDVRAGSITDLPLQDASIDRLVTTNTLYFVDDLPVAIAELARVRAPGGRVVIGIADPDAMRRMPYTPYGFILRPVDEVVAAMAAGGLELTGHARVGDGPDAYHLLVAQA